MMVFEKGASRFSWNSNMRRDESLGLAKRIIAISNKSQCKRKWEFETWTPSLQCGNLIWYFTRLWFLLSRHRHSFTHIHFQWCRYLHLMVHQEKLYKYNAKKSIPTRIRTQWNNIERLWVVTAGWFLIEIIALYSTIHVH